MYKQYKKSSKKLTPNLLDKKRYAVHLKNLKFYQDKGIIVTKVHRVLTFKQSKWLKSYIEFNTARRNEATSDFARDYYKLLNNAVFGKFIIKIFQNNH